MLQPFLIGTKLYLRALETLDLEGPYLAWLNDQETTRYLETGRFPTTRKALEEAIQASARQTDSLFLAVVDRETDRHIGTIKLGPINWVHRLAPIGILIGEATFRGRGYGREALELILAHAFEQLDLHKVAAGAYADHAGSVELFTGTGFSIEGRLRDHLYREGRYYDKVLLGLVRDEYLKRQDGRRVSEAAQEQA